MDNRGNKTNTLFKNIAKKESMNLREFLRKKKVTIKVNVSVWAVESSGLTTVFPFSTFQILLSFWPAKTWRRSRDG